MKNELLKALVELDSEFLEKGGPGSGIKGHKTPTALRPDRDFTGARTAEQWNDREQNRINTKVEIGYQPDGKQVFTTKEGAKEIEAKRKERLKNKEEKPTGIHNPSFDSIMSGKDGESEAGSRVKTANKYGDDMESSKKVALDDAKTIHSKKLSELKQMPKPNLTKAEEQEEEQMDKLIALIKSMSKEQLKETLNTLDEKQTVLFTEALTKAKDMTEAAWGKKSKKPQERQEYLMETVSNDPKGLGNADEDLMDEENKEQKHQGGSHKKVEGWEGQVIKAIEQSENLIKALFPEKLEVPAKACKVGESKDSVENQICWKVEELKRLKDSAWLISDETPEAKEILEKKFSKLKSEIKELAKKWGSLKKAETIKVNEKLEKDCEDQKKEKKAEAKKVSDEEPKVAQSEFQMGFKKSEESDWVEITESEYEEELEKALRGEGSRGGKVIGHTKSGRPIYEGSSAHKKLQVRSMADKLDPNISPEAKAKARALRNDRGIKTPENDYKRYFKFREEEGATPGKKGEKVVGQSKYDETHSGGLGETKREKYGQAAGNELSGKTGAGVSAEWGKKHSNPDLAAGAVNRAKELHAKKLQAIKDAPKPNLTKSIQWADPNKLLKANTLGRNAHYSVEALILQEQAKAEQLKKSQETFLDGVNEVTKKSENKLDWNDMIEKGLDRSVDQLADENFKLEKSGAYTVKSFSEEDMEKAIEQSENLLGLKKGGPGSGRKGHRTIKPNVQARLHSEEIDKLVALKPQNQEAETKVASAISAEAKAKREADKKVLKIGSGKTDFEQAVAGGMKIMKAKSSINDEIEALLKADKE